MDRVVQNISKRSNGIDHVPMKQWYRLQYVYEKQWYSALYHISKKPSYKPCPKEAVATDNGCKTKWYRAGPGDAVAQTMSL